MPGFFVSSWLCGEYALYSPHEVRRMIGYIHALPDWPRFRWDREALEQRLLAVHHSQ